MAIIKMKKMREMSDKDLEERVRELQLELSKERASSEIGGTVKNPGRIREIRKTLARIKTCQAVKTNSAMKIEKSQKKAAQIEKGSAEKGKNKDNDKETDNIKNKTQIKKRGDGK